MFCSVPDSLCPFRAFCMFSGIPFAFFSSCVSLRFAFLSTFVSLFVCILSRISRHSFRAHFRHSFRVLLGFRLYPFAYLRHSFRDHFRHSFRVLFGFRLYPFAYFRHSFRAHFRHSFRVLSAFVSTLSRISGIPFARIRYSFRVLFGFCSASLRAFSAYGTFPVLLSSLFAFRHGLSWRAEKDTQSRR